MIEHVKRLIFDADDTLWDNNIYYVRATEDFFKLCVTAGIPQKSAQRDFDQLEAVVVKERGYGSKSFKFILNTLFESYPVLLNNERYQKKYKKIIREFHNHMECPPSLFPDVISTLEKLSSSYDLYVLTKGNLEEQKEKLHKSNLLSHFKECFIVSEKETETYLSILRQHKWMPDEICMIGNSPKSDINPALRVGMHAVFIPYPFTWKLDNEALLGDHPRLITLTKFSDLIDLFKLGEKGNQPQDTVKKKR
jgi:putative hydrolase of the HAD superfamily